MMNYFTLRDLAIKGYRVVINFTISTVEQNYNLWTVAGSHPQYIKGRTRVNLSVNNVVGSSTIEGNSLTVPNQFTSGDFVTITNNSSIVGRGGPGGNGGDGSNPGTPGITVPGAAILVQYPVTVVNNATVAGGGGGGGGGGGTTTAPVPPSGNRGPGVGGGGGGGAGYLTSDGGAPNGQGSTFPGLTAGSGGAGVAPAGPGGPGGGLGSNGTPGTTSAGAGGAGGTAGFYINGAPFVTWSPTGTRLGRSV